MRRGMTCELRGSTAVLYEPLVKAAERRFII
jgi:hypothetical protein